MSLAGTVCGNQGSGSDLDGIFLAARTSPDAAFFTHAAQLSAAAVVAHSEIQRGEIGAAEAEAKKPVSILPGSIRNTGYFPSRSHVAFARKNQHLRQREHGRAIALPQIDRWRCGAHVSPAWD